MGFSAGKFDSKTQTKFLVIPSVPSRAVVKFYKDYVISVPFDRVTHKFDRTIVIEPLSKPSSTIATWENVGPLSPR